MAVFVWSSITTAQSLTLGGADQIAFDLPGSTATAVGAAVGVAVTTLTYAGRDIPVQNAVLTGGLNQFLLLDGSRLVFDLRPGTFTAGVATLPPRTAEPTRT